MRQHLTRVLVVYDNAELATRLMHILQSEHYEVRFAATDQLGVATATTWPADLVILDVVRHAPKGFDLLHALADQGCHVPVLILSPGREELLRTDETGSSTNSHGNAGPTLIDLVERVRELLVHAHAPNGADRIRFGSVVVDPEAHTVTRCGERCALTPKAFALLLALARRQGAVASRTDLLREVWGYGPHVLTRTVDSHVAELRRKLEDDPAQPRHIVTVWAVGYRFVV